ncbi:MAG: alpha-glucosidase [Lachnospiraceae bacterium]|nr:alpha-glucosidase [Lachnospiraceae bacterium]
MKGDTSLRWWQKTIAYEIYVNSFQDSDGDGYGDLNGIRSRLEHLESLGVGAIWLTPVYASPMVDNGYDVADYYHINPRYGTMEEMEALIKEAGDRGIRIVMDLVFNHTSDKCVWFTESEKSAGNEYSDWYIWKDAEPDGGAPNNWRSIFGGSAWEWSESRQQYYLHTFAKEQPDLNWENPKVREELYNVALFWLDKGVGGFRMDAIPYIKKPAGFPGGEADEVDGMTGIHEMTANTPGILDFLNEFKQRVTAGRDIFTVGEANGVTPADLQRWVGRDGVFDMIFEFSHVNLDFQSDEIWCRTKKWTLRDLKEAITASQKATEENGWYPIFFENHDKERSIEHYFPKNADPVKAGKALATVLLMLRGTPFIYQGEELGMTNVRWPSIDDYNDINSVSQYNIALQNGLSEKEALECVYRFSRDNARTPMQWDTTEYAGFTTGTPWLPVNENYQTVNAETEALDEASVLSWYKRLARFRKEHAALVYGTYTEVLNDREDVYAFVREDGEEKLLIAVNFSGEEAEYDITSTGAGETEEILISSYGDDDDRGGAMLERLRPYEAVVLRIANEV